MILDKQFDRDVIIYAYRYTLGRHSYAPGLMRDKLDEIWDQLSDGDKNLIIHEAEDHIRCEIEFGDDTFKHDYLGWKDWVDNRKRIYEQSKH